MAEGGGDRRTDSDHPFQPNRAVVRRVNRQLSRHDIGNQARYLLNTFIQDRLHGNRLSDTLSVDDLTEPGTPTGPPIDQIRDVAKALRCIGDELDQDYRLQKMIDSISPDGSQQTFMNVAKEIFSDGVFNWGRVVALFYFAFRMILKAIDQLPVIRGVIDWVVRFIVDYVAPWIIERGGWEAIQEYFGSTTVQAAGVFAAGVICAAAFILWKNH